MKAIVTGDLHLKLWSDKKYDSTGIPIKLIEILQTIEQMVVYGKSHDINTIIVAGDINDTKGVVSVRAFVLFRKLIEKYPEINWILIHGNHDNTVGGDIQHESSVQLFEEYSNVKVITSSEIMNFSGTDILLLPHSKDIVEELKKYSKQHPKILISHFGLDEAQLSSGISIRAGVKATDLKSFKLVLLGHYHKPQYLDCGKTSIYYVGSPIPVRRDEATEEKRFLVIDTDTFDVVSVLTEGYRRFCEFVLDADTNTEELLKLVKQQTEIGNHIVIKNKTHDLPLDIRKYITENAQVIDDYEKDINIRGITSNMTPEEQLNKYMDIMSISDNDREEYLKIGLEIIRIEEK